MPLTEVILSTTESLSRFAKHRYARNNVAMVAVSTQRAVTLGVSGVMGLTRERSEERGSWWRQSASTKEKLRSRIGTEQSQQVKHVLFATLQSSCMYRSNHIQDSNGPKRPILHWHSCNQRIALLSRPPPAKDQRLSGIDKIGTNITEIADLLLALSLDPVVAPSGLAQVVLAA
jgi:hypothetical protein